MALSDNREQHDDSDGSTCVHRRRRGHKPEEAEEEEEKVEEDGAEEREKEVKLVSRAKRKSKAVCSMWASGECRFGDKCHFTHEKENGPKRVKGKGKGRRFRVVTCWDWEQGQCPRGDTCTFAHWYTDGNGGRGNIGGEASREHEQDLQAEDCRGDFEDQNSREDWWSPPSPEWEEEGAEECPYWKFGLCWYGEECWFAHIPKEDPQVPEDAFKRYDEKLRTRLAWEEEEKARIEERRKKDEELRERLRVEEEVARRDFAEAQSKKLQEAEGGWREAYLQREVIPWRPEGQEAEEEVPICFLWEKHKFCQYGTECIYRHPGQEAEVQRKRKEGGDTPQEKKVRLPQRPDSGETSVPSLTTASSPSPSPEPPNLPSNPPHLPPFDTCLNWLVAGRCLNGSDCKHSHYIRVTGDAWSNKTFYPSEREGGRKEGREAPTSWPGDWREKWGATEKRAERMYDPIEGKHFYSTPPGSHKVPPSVNPRTRSYYPLAFPPEREPTRPPFHMHQETLTFVPTPSPPPSAFSPPSTMFPRSGRGRGQVQVKEEIQ